MAEFASLADVKQHLNMTSTGNDDELGLMLDAAEDIVRSMVGSFAAGTVTEPVTVHGGVAILRGRPVGDVVLSDSSIIGFTVDHAAGLLRDVYVNGSTAWSSWGTSGLTATYSSGDGTVPAAVTLATVIIAGHLWETQRGTSPSALTLQQPDGFDQAFAGGAGFAIPNRAKELLASVMRSSSQIA